MPTTSGQCDIELPIDEKLMGATLKVIQQCDKPILLVAEMPPISYASQGRFVEIMESLVRRVEEQSGVKFTILCVPHGTSVTAIALEGQLEKYVRQLQNSDQQVGSPEQVGSV